MRQEQVLLLSEHRQVRAVPMRSQIEPASALSVPPPRYEIRLLPDLRFFPRSRSLACVLSPFSASSFPIAISRVRPVSLILCYRSPRVLSLCSRESLSSETCSPLRAALLHLRSFHGTRVIARIDLLLSPFLLMDIRWRIDRRRRRSDPEQERGSR